SSDLPKAIAHPFSSLAKAKLILISVARSDPPVIELTRNGALISLFKKLDCKEILLKSISGNALCINEIPSKPVDLFTPSTSSVQQSRICSVFLTLISVSILLHPYPIHFITIYSQFTFFIFRLKEK